MPTESTSLLKRVIEASMGHSLMMLRGGDDNGSHISCAFLRHKTNIHDRNGTLHALIIVFAFDKHGTEITNVVRTTLQR